MSYVQGQITQLNGVDYECNGQQYSGQKIWPVANVALRGPTDTGNTMVLGEQSRNILKQIYYFLNLALRVCKGTDVFLIS